MDKKNFKNMWVYIEHDGKQVHPVALELCCETRRLCDESGDKLIAVIAGTLPESEIDKVKDCGVDGVIYVSGTGYDRYNTEAYTNLFTVLCRKYKPSAVFVGGTTTGATLPRALRPASRPAAPATRPSSSITRRLPISSLLSPPPAARSWPS